MEVFLEAGFTRANVLDVVTVIATKTISNYTNHLTHTPKEAFMADPALAWRAPPANRAAAWPRGRSRRAAAPVGDRGRTAADDGESRAGPGRHGQADSGPARRRRTLGDGVEPRRRCAGGGGAAGRIAARKGAAAGMPVRSDAHPRGGPVRRWRRRRSGRRQSEVRPDRPVPAGRSERGRQRIAVGGPEDAAGGDGKAGRGEQEFRAQRAEALEKRGVEGGVAGLAGVLRAVVEALRREVLEARIGQKDGDRFALALAVGGVEIGRAEEDEGRLRRGDGERAVEEAEPERRLVVVAVAVAVLGPVEDRRRGVEREETQPAGGGLEGDDPVAGGGQTLERRGLRRPFRGQAGAGQVAPEEGAQIGRLRGQRQSGEQGHPPLSREPAPALGVAGAADAAVAVEVEAGLDAAVGAERKTQGIALSGRRRAVGQCVQGPQVQVPVDAGQQEDVGVQRRDPGDGRSDLEVVAADVAEQEAGTVAREFDIPNRDAEGLGRGRGDKGRAQDEAAQERAASPGEGRDQAEA